MIVGGWAVGYHAEPRFTKDLDVFIGPSNEVSVAMIGFDDLVAAKRAAVQ